MRRILYFLGSESSHLLSGPRSCHERRPHQPVGLPDQPASLIERGSRWVVPEFQLPRKVPGRQNVVSFVNYNFCFYIIFFGKFQIFLVKYRIRQNKRPFRNKRPPKNSDFRRGEYTKPMAFDWWFFKGESTQNQLGFDVWFFKGGSTQNQLGFDVWFFKGGSTQNQLGFDGWFFKGGSTQNRWILMCDFSKGGVHKTDGFRCVIFQRGEYTKPIVFYGFWNVSFIASKNWALRAFISANTAFMITMIYFDLFIL